MGAKHDQGGPAYERLTAALRASGSKQGKGWMWQCPEHDDRNPSLSVSHTDDRALVHCHAGCRTGDILAKLDLGFEDLFDTPHSQAGSPDVRYEYRDSRGRLIATKVRGPGKQFFWERGESGDSSADTLYRLPDLLKARDTGQPVWAAEGEKDADRLRSLGEIATTGPHGAGTWRDEWSQVFTGLRVYVVADRDRPGYNHADKVAASVRRYAEDVRVFLPKPTHKGADLSDHLDAGFASHEDLIEVHHPLTKLEQPMPEKITFIDFAKYARDGIPPVKWLIKDWIAKGEIVIVAGPPKSGKTNTVNHLVQCLVLGKDWMGYEVPDTAKVIWFDEEQPEHTTVRTVMRLASGLEAQPWANGLSVASGHGVQLDNDRGIAKLRAILDEHRPDLVVIDSFAKATANFDENSNSDMAKVSRYLIALRNEFGCCFILLHHVTKARMKSFKPGDVPTALRGAGELSGNVDTLIAAKLAKGKPQQFWVELRRESDTIEFPSLKLDRIATDDTEGPVLIKLHDGPDEPLDDVAAARLAQAKASQLDALAAATEPVETQALNRLVDGSEKTAQRARNELELAGLIRNPHKGQWELVRYGSLTDEGGAA